MWGSVISTECILHVKVCSFNFFAGKKLKLNNHMLQIIVCHEISVLKGIPLKNVKLWGFFGKKILIKVPVYPYPRQETVVKPGF